MLPLTLINLKTKFVVNFPSEALKIFYLGYMVSEVSLNNNLKNNL